MTDNSEQPFVTEKERSEPYVSRLWLVRHGETDWNREGRLCGHQDVSLSSTGEMQARWVGAQLNSRPIVAVYASDLQRTVKTAELLAQQHSLPLTIQTQSAWRELSFGEWEGLTYAEIAARYPDQLDFFTKPLHSSPPGGETLAELLQRVQPAFAQLVRDARTLPAGELVLVSHSGVLRVLVCSLLGIPFERYWQLSFAYGSISAIDFLADVEDVAATTTLSLLNHQSLYFL
ncbi:alpha-ribazole phosphatase [Dictyobacter kobayashii]|nr:alpha-ribazole phosphatase [Dictyobacter kobayashii]